MENGGYEQVYSMYTWLIEKVKEDCDRVNNKEYELFHVEYEKTLKLMISAREQLKGNNKLLKFNSDSVQRITKIVGITREEYDMAHDENPDIEQLNSMIGWYTSIIEETNLFINSLFEKQ